MKEAGNAVLRSEKKTRRRKRKYRRRFEKLKLKLKFCSWWQVRKRGRRDPVKKTKSNNDKETHILINVYPVLLLL